MNIAKLTAGKITRDTVNGFGGYVHDHTAGENTFFGMENLSSRRYPYLSPRERRKAVAVSLPQGQNLNVLGMLAKDKLAMVVDGSYPAFAPGTFYKRTAQNTYEKLQKRPYDWGVNSADYYRRSGEDYFPVTGQTPDFYYGGVKIEGVSDALHGAGERQLISMGANIVIFPDKVMYNTISGAVTFLESSTGELTGEAVGADNPMRITMTNENGSLTFSTISGVNDTVNNTYVGPDTPRAIYQQDENGADTDVLLRAPKNGEYWLDTSGEEPVLKIYADASGLWSALASAYVKITHSSLKSGDSCLFRKGDAVEMSGFSRESLNGFHVVEASGVTGSEGWIVISAVPDGTEREEFLYNIVTPEEGQSIDDISVESTADNAAAVVIAGNTAYRLTDGAWEADEEHPVSYYTRTLCIRRTVPQMDFVTESKNRLWGCRYGSEVNEIYACKLGDPTNSFCYQGIASDSYAVSLGSDGPFTGAVAYDDGVIFFKENVIHKIYGSKPANFQVTAMAGRGIKAGSDRSLAMGDETLYYLSDGGVTAYGGGIPVSIGTPLGDVRLTNGVGGMANGRYYLCATDEKSGERCLYCFDTATGQWYREDAADVRYMANYKGALLAAGENQLVILNGESADSPLPLAGTERPVTWFGETGVIGLTTPDEKYYSFFQLRLEAGAGSLIRVAAEYDSDGVWHEKFVCRPERRRMYEIPFVSPRCDHMRLRFSGSGDCTIYNFSKYYENGGDTVHG